MPTQQKIDAFHDEFAKVKSPLFHDGAPYCSFEGEMLAWSDGDSSTATTRTALERGPATSRAMMAGIAQRGITSYVLLRWLHWMGRRGPIQQVEYEMVLPRGLLREEEDMHPDQKYVFAFFRGAAHEVARMKGVKLDEHSLCWVRVVLKGYGDN